MVPSPIVNAVRKAYAALLPLATDVGDPLASRTMKHSCQLHVRVIDGPWRREAAAGHSVSLSRARSIISFLPRVRREYGILRLLRPVWKFFCASMDADP
jgi:hypothetical protein